MLPSQSASGIKLDFCNVYKAVIAMRRTNNFQVNGNSDVIFLMHPQEAIMFPWRLFLTCAIG